jgi:uncharacterized protein YkwD
MSIIRTGKSGPLLLLLMLSFGVTEGKNIDITTSEGHAGKHKLRHRINDTSTWAQTPPKWNRESIDTTSGADYMTETEREVVVEMNMMRRDPPLYAQKYLAPLRAYYQGDLLKYPGKTPIATNEGISALEECIRELKHAKPAPCLSPCKGLALSARDHVRDQGQTGAIGHTGSDGSSLVTRLNRYGRWEIFAGENISYGYSQARAIVAALLIDDGEPSRGHRKNLLNNSFKVVGVDIGPHREYGKMCVMDFAGGYSSKQSKE